MNVNVIFNDPVVGDGVTVAAINGFQPGDDGQALAAELGEPWYYQQTGDSGEAGRATRHRAILAVKDRLVILGQRPSRAGGCAERSAR